ncbi:OLC1v1023772C1 [Oldenlandia corymbosa var. corymbosa]|uniref:OLC1v1023772C1 n=1 Tax=Oldenlandia corymbosa var. corymbosa TaxID=529605 RepID=A0AAV1C147_OLDCO|nr:OLC1v1023772C1 [Oldenlandia corymbosa var. corymbosa]
MDTLDLISNNFTGSVPSDIGRNMTKLWDLLMAENSLTGVIPPSIGNMSSLVNLMLDRNQFSGKIPAELGQHPQLEFVVLWGNQLTGKEFSGFVPGNILSKLEQLYLLENNLAGALRD